MTHEEPKPIERSSAQFWLENTMKRIYPNSQVGSGEPLSLLAARNERISFQACVRNCKMDPIRIRAAVASAPDWDVRIRRVGYAPMQHLNSDSPRGETDGIGHTPGMVPDPLFPVDWADVGPEENCAFWISLTVPEAAMTGLTSIKVTLTIESEYRFPGWQPMEPVSVEMEARIDVRPLTIKPRHAFPATQWINIQSIWDYYKIEPFSERFWELADAYIANLVSHGVDVVYSPIFNNRL